MGRRRFAVRAKAMAAMANSCLGLIGNAAEILTDIGHKDNNSRLQA
jgi:hypothetical protein